MASPITKKVMLVDSDIYRGPLLAGGIRKACEQIATPMENIEFTSARSEWVNWKSKEIVIAHGPDLRNCANGNLSLSDGPKIVKFRAFGAKEEPGECRARVYAIYRRVAPPAEGGPTPFDKAEPWMRVLRFL